MTTLPNLKELYSNKYRIDYERDINGKPIGRTPDFMQLKASRGHIYVHSATHLGFATDKNRPSLKKIAGLTLVQDGEEGQNYIFEISKLDKLAHVFGLHRKRIVSEDEKQLLREIGSTFRFSKLTA